MDYQWYPGHMTKARRQMQEDMKLIDLVIELTDARIPLSSRNPDIDSLAGGKSRILVLNKADLADEKVNALWKDYYEKKGILTLEADSRNAGAVRPVAPMIAKACEEKMERDRRRGIVNRPVRAMVCGIPNVGKSTFINTLAGRASAKTGNRPGVTRGKQWISVGKNIQLLDTPGILWPKFDDREVGIRLAVTGSIRDEVLDRSELALWLIDYLRKAYPEEASRLFPPGEGPEVLEQTAFHRGCLLSGNRPDPERAAGLILDDFRKGKSGKISLEIPPSTV